MSNRGQVGKKGGIFILNLHFGAVPVDGDVVGVRLEQVRGAAMKKSVS